MAAWPSPPDAGPPAGLLALGLGGLLLASFGLRLGGWAGLALLLGGTALTLAGLLAFGALLAVWWRGRGE